MTADAPTRREIVRRAVAALLDRLPRGWEGAARTDADAEDRGIDAILEVRSPDGHRATIAVGASATLLAKEVEPALSRLSRGIATLGRPATPLLASRFVSPRLQDFLSESEIAYADATGNLRLAIDRPSLFVRDIGASRDPWRGPGRPRGDLKGRAAARLVRALVDFAPPYSLPELAETSGASVGATYRLMDFLEEERLVRRSRSTDTAGTPRGRSERGRIVEVRWRPLLSLWSSQFRSKAPSFRPYLAPRGAREALDRLRGDDAEYVVTGSFGAASFAPFAPPRLAVVYASNPSGLAAALDLRETDRGANVLIAEPLDPVMFARSCEIDGLRVASPSQIAADLLAGVGREPEEAQALMDWMEANESAWRR